MQTPAERLAEAEQVVEHDYAANTPSSALIYAARDVLVELRAIRRRAEAIAVAPLPLAPPAKVVEARGAQVAARKILGDV